MTKSFEINPWLPQGLDRSAFTDGEAEILIKIGCGLSVKQAASELNIAEKELEGEFRLNLFRKIGIHGIDKARWLVIKHWREEVKAAALERGRLIIGQEAFDEGQSLAITMAALGYKNRQIAEVLNIKETTVGTNFSYHIFPKAQVKNRLELREKVMAEYPDYLEQEAERLGVWKK